MTFLIWRLHRAHAIASAVAIGAVAALIVPTGIAIANSYHHAVMNCSANHVGCGDISGIVWVLANLGWALLAAAVWGGALAALFTWWRGPDNAVDGPVKFIYFDIEGVAPIAYTVFAMALFFRPLFAISQNVAPLPGAGYPPLSWGLFADVLSSKTEHVTYLPASRFWPVQGVESGIFLALALALAIFTYWSLTTRET
jgi:hypothetical protein